MSDQQEDRRDYPSVRIVSDGLPVGIGETRVYHSQTGEVIRGIHAARIDLVAGDIPRATLKVFEPMVDIVCEAGFVVAREEWRDAELPPPDAGEYLVVLERNGEAWQGICTYSIRQGIWVDRPDFATVTHYQPLPPMPYGVGLRSAHSG